MTRTRETQPRRRRDSDNLAGYRKKLHVDEAKLDRQRYAYRWANDAGNRIHDLTVSDDWEIVPDRDTDNQGARHSVVAGTGERGNAYNAVLLRKPKAYHDEDVRKQQRFIDEQESGLGAPGEGQYDGDGTTITNGAAN